MVGANHGRNTANSSRRDFLSRLGRRIARSRIGVPAWARISTRRIPHWRLSVGPAALRSEAEDSAFRAAREGRHSSFSCTGGPSQVDLFDPKQDLKKYAGKTPSPGLDSGCSSPLKQNAGILPSPYEFIPRGDSGLVFSELLPHMAGVADDFAMIRSMFTETPNHEPALSLIHTGRVLKGRPIVRRLGCLRLGLREPEPSGLRRVG